MWQEAFGRVVLEARVLDIPVIVTNRGGLPEAVHFDPNCIANGYKDILHKVKNFLSIKV